MTWSRWWFQTKSHMVSNTFDVLSGTKVRSPRLKKPLSSNNVKLHWTLFIFSFYGRLIYIKITLYSETKKYSPNEPHLKERECCMYSVLFYWWDLEKIAKSPCQFFCFLRIDIKCFSWTSHAIWVFEIRFSIQIIGYSFYNGTVH